MYLDKEIENSNEAFLNTLGTICNWLGADPENTQIPHLQENIPSFNRRVSDLMEMMGVGYSFFDSQSPYYS